MGNKGTREIGGRYNAPTLTAVFASSSDARLPPPCLLLVLKRLLLLGVRSTALMGRCWWTPVGEPGGDIVIFPLRPSQTVVRVTRGRTRKTGEVNYVSKNIREGSHQRWYYSVSIGFFDSFLRLSPELRGLSSCANQVVLIITYQVDKKGEGGLRKREKS